MFSRWNDDQSAGATLWREDGGRNELEGLGAAENQVLRWLHSEDTPAVAPAVTPTPVPVVTVQE